MLREAQQIVRPFSRNTIRRTAVCSTRATSERETPNVLPHWTSLFRHLVNAWQSAMLAVPRADPKGERS